VFLLVFYAPNLLGHSDNYIEANPLVTPTHIVPEWYFLPFYAILRCIPNKLGGVVVMFLAILILLALPLYSKKTIVVRNLRFHFIFKYFFFLLIVDVVLLGILGAMPVEEHYIFCAQICTIYYFFYFIIIIPFCELLEHLAYTYNNTSKLDKE